MVGLFPSFFHPPESFSLASKGWLTAEVGGTSPRGFQRLGVPLEGGTGRAGRGLAGLVTLSPPSRSTGSDWRSLTLVAASGSGTPLLPLERLQVALATGTLSVCAVPACFPVSVATARQAREVPGAGQVLQLIGWEELRPAPAPARQVQRGPPWLHLDPQTRTFSHLQTKWAQKLRTLASAGAGTP